eukprot:scaffold376835_cov17-Prasinocladus_malaysianus.AAC.1
MDTLFTVMQFIMEGIKRRVSFISHRTWFRMSVVKTIHYIVAATWSVPEVVIHHIQNNSQAPLYSHEAAPAGTRKLPYLLLTHTYQRPQRQCH